MKNREAFRPRLGVGYAAVAHDISAMLQHRDDDSEPRWPSKADTRPWRSRRIILSSSFRNHDSVLGYWGLGPRRRPHKLSLPSGFGRPPGSCPSLPCATLRHLHPCWERTPPRFTVFPLDFERRLPEGLLSQASPDSSCRAELRYKQKMCAATADLM